MLLRQGSRREPFGKFRRYVQDGAVNKCGLRTPLTVPRIQCGQVPKNTFAPTEVTFRTRQVLTQFLCYKMVFVPELGGPEV